MYEEPATPSVAAEMWTGANRRILDSNGSIIEHDDTSCSASLELMDDKEDNIETNKLREIDKKQSCSIDSDEKQLEIDKIILDIDKITVSSRLSNFSTNSSLVDSKISDCSSLILMDTHARPPGE